MLEVRRPLRGDARVLQRQASQARQLEERVDAAVADGRAVEVEFLQFGEKVRCAARRRRCGFRQVELPEAGHRLEQFQGLVGDPRGRQP